MVCNERRGSAFLLSLNDLFSFLIKKVIFESLVDLTSSCFVFPPSFSHPLPTFLDPSFTLLPLPEFESITPVSKVLKLFSSTVVVKASKSIHPATSYWLSHYSEGSTMGPPIIHNNHPWNSCHVGKLKDASALLRVKTERMERLRGWRHLSCQLKNYLSPPNWSVIFSISRLGFCQCPQTPANIFLDRHC